MFSVFGFYKFKKISLLKKHKEFFQSEFLNNKVRGTLILSSEGINGTISGEKNRLPTEKFRGKKNKSLIFG